MPWRAGFHKRNVRTVLAFRHPSQALQSVREALGATTMPTVDGRPRVRGVLRSPDRSAVEELPMPILLFIVLVILIAQIGF